MIIIKRSPTNNVTAPDRNHSPAIPQRAQKVAIVPFDDYEIHGCEELCENGESWIEQCDDAEAEFFTIYGHIPGAGVQAIGDFSTREFAEEVLQRIAPD